MPASDPLQALFEHSFNADPAALSSSARVALPSSGVEPGELELHDDGAS